MSYIAKHIIGSDERLVGIARAHWIYVLMGLFWAGIVLIVGGGIRTLMMRYGLGTAFNDPIVTLGYDFGPGSWWYMAVFATVAALLFFVFLIEYFSTEVGLTTKRIVRKSGLISVEVQEIEIEEIDAARIHHGWLGTVLGYGSVYLDCRFVGDVHLPTIRRPYVFLRALHKVQSADQHRPVGLIDDEKGKDHAK